jgi:hypothetical protein
MLLSSFVLATDFTVNNVFWIDVNESSNSIVDYAGNTITNNGVTIQNTDEMVFDGSADYINVNSVISEIQADTVGTLCVWLKSDTTAKQFFISASESAGTDRINFYVELTSQLLTFGVGANGNKWFTDTDSGQSTTSLIHICGVQDGADPKIYVDGSEPAQTFYVTVDKTEWYDDFTINSVDVGRRVYSGTPSGYFDGIMHYASMWDDALTPAEITELYNEGDSFNPYLPYLVTPSIFELNLSNLYDGSLLTNFTAKVEYFNGTTETKYTNNGTIYFGDNELANVTFYNVSGGSFFNQTFHNWNTNDTLEGETYQAFIQLKATESNTLADVGVFNSTIGTYFNESDSNNYTKHYVNTGTYTIQAISGRYFKNATQIITVNDLDVRNETIYFSNMINVTAFDINYSNQIYNFSVTTDDGHSNSTLDGNITVFCSYPTCDLYLNASGVDYVPKNYTNVWNDTQVTNLSLAKAFFYFVTADTLTPIFNATINITTPDARKFQLRTASDGSINFSLYFGENIINGNYSIDMNGTQGYVTPVFNERNLNENIVPYNETIKVGVVGITFNVYDRETGLRLTGVPVDVLMLGQFNVTTTTGLYNYGNLTISTGDYVVQAISEGYGVEQKTFTFTGQANATIDFYLLNLTGANTGSLFASVKDEFYRTTPDAKVVLLEYDTISKDYIEVSECYSNSNGECLFYVELNTKTYILQASKTISGEYYFDSTEPEVIKVDNEVRNLFLRAITQNILTTLDGVVINATETYSTNWNEINKSRILVYYSVSDGSSRMVCLQYLKDDVESFKYCKHTILELPSDTE